MAWVHLHCAESEAPERSFAGHRVVPYGLPSSSPGEHDSLDVDTGLREQAAGSNFSGFAG